MELEATGLSLVDRHADDVRRQHVAGELDALELQAERARQHMRQRGFSDAGQVFDQQVTARQEARQREAHLLLLAENDAAGGVDRPLDRTVQHALRFDLRFLQEHAAIVLDAI